MFFVVVGSLFAVAALVAGSHVPERIVQSLALAWAACMLVAAVFAAWELVQYLRRKGRKSHDR
jgi:phosphate/sulfate permease